MFLKNIKDIKKYAKNYFVTAICIGKIGHLYYVKKYYCYNSVFSNLWTKSFGATTDMQQFH